MDAGANTADLQSIVAFLNSGIDPLDGSADDGVHNFQLDALNGKYQPIGSIWVGYEGIAVCDTNAVRFTVTQWSTSNGSPTHLVVTSGLIQQASAVAIGRFPEPSGVVVGGVGLVAMVGRRRRADWRR